MKHTEETAKRNDIIVRLMLKRTQTHKQTTSQLSLTVVQKHINVHHNTPVDTHQE